MLILSKGPWIITLDGPSYVAAMSHIPKRDIIEQVYITSLTHALDIRSTENGENNVFEDDNEQADGETDITSSKIEYLDQLRKELAQHKQQNQLLMTRRNNVFKSMVTLHEMYETGLDGIARMNDLRFVPDNVMPENIPR